VKSDQSRRVENELHKELDLRRVEYYTVHKDLHRRLCLSLLAQKHAAAKTPYFQAIFFRAFSPSPPTPPPPPPPGHHPVSPCRVSTRWGGPSTGWRGTVSHLQLTVGNRTAAACVNAWRTILPRPRSRGHRLQRPVRHPVLSTHALTSH